MRVRGLTQTIALTTTLLATAQAAARSFGSNDALSEDSDGARSLICDAAEQGQLSILKLLVECGVEVNSSGVADYRPLQLALDEG